MRYPQVDATSEGQTRGSQGLLGDAGRKDATVNLKLNARPQGNNQGNNRVTIAPAEAEKMPIPINKYNEYKRDTRTDGTGG